MKIVMLNDALVRGGKERRLIELLKGLNQYPDMEVELVLFSKRIDYPEIHSICSRIHILERKPRKDPRVFVRLYRLIKKIQPDLIHSWGSMPSVLAIPSAVGLQIPLINAMITNAKQDMAWWHEDYVRGRLTFPLSKIVLGNSKAGLKAYDAPVKKSYCVYNGFDFRRIKDLEEPAIIRERFQLCTPKLVGMLGAFEKRKDYPTYIKAAISLLQKRKDVSFLAIGGGAQLKACQAMVPETYRSRILFPGMVSNVESLINVLDIGVLATNSRSHGEGISNAILEFMALGKPVVATLGGGTPEIVTEGKTGFMVEPYDPDSMAERIATLLDDPNAALQMGQAGQERVKNDFNLQHMTRKYRDIYFSLPGAQNPSLHKAVSS